DGIVGGALLDAVGAARRQREAQLAPGSGGTVEVAGQQEGVVNAFDGMGHVVFLSVGWRRGRAGIGGGTGRDSRDGARPGISFRDGRGWRENRSAFHGSRRAAAWVAGWRSRVAGSRRIRRFPQGKRLISR